MIKEIVPTLTGSKIFNQRGMREGRKGGRVVTLITYPASGRLQGDWLHWSLSPSITSSPLQINASTLNRTTHQLTFILLSHYIHFHPSVNQQHSTTQCRYSQNKHSPCRPCPPRLVRLLPPWLLPGVHLSPTPNLAP